MRPSMVALLTLIRSKEAPKGYGQIYGGAKPRSLLLVDCSKMTIDEVLKMQGRMIDNGSRSTACAGYQFIRKTLRMVKAQMGLTGKEVMNADLQDRMAIQLMVGRGLNAYMNGTLSAEGFANNLAKEWASLPVVTAIQGASRRLKPGQSYYAGDGLNASHHKPDKFLAAVKALRV